MTPSHRFRILADIAWVACDITINDVPVIRNYSGKRLNMQYPVSDFIVPGANTLQIRTLLEDSESGASATRATATLQATSYETSVWTDLFSVQTRALPGTEGEATTETSTTALGTALPQTSDYDRDGGVYLTTRTIHLEAQVPAWNWARSSEITKSPETLELLRRWYMAYHEAVRRRDFESIAGSLTEKTSELAIAHNLSPDVVAFEIALLRKMERPDLALVEVDWDNTRMALGAGNRLARLYHPRSGTIIRYVDSDQLRHSFDFWVRRDGASWKIAR